MKRLSFYKTLFLTVCLIIPGLCEANAAEEETQKLPVMKITVDGSITKDMAYTNGTMQLTDETGHVVPHR